MLISSIIDVVGYVAAFLTTISFLPQVIKTLRTRDTSGISLTMYSIFVSGVVLWFIYGFLRDDKIVMMANVVTFILAGSVLLLKIKAVRKR